MPAPVPSSLSDPRLDDYARIAEAIAFIQQHRHQQPDLAAIASYVHLSESHLQRLFTRWAGISPKRFLQYLTVEHAKAAIASSPNLLDLTLESGLSSPGRLHDLFVNLEAMSPGEYKNGGAGLTIDYGIHPTPFGPALIATTHRGICALRFLPSPAIANATAELHTDWPQAQLIPNQAKTQAISDRLFPSSLLSPPSSPPPLTLHLKGTNFQIQVWRALLAIPPGHLTTYQTIAKAIKRPTATRAVGNAIGKNPIAYLIPCHRVIRETGNLGGYRWGLERKAAIVGWEAGRQAGDN
jgi:AraC family transcriptional regulator of adaptative response/methylated-DNA-[protein]-cysteine methyltransferase